MLSLVLYFSGCAVIGRYDYFTADSEFDLRVDASCRDYVGAISSGIEIQLQGPPSVTEIKSQGYLVGLCSSRNRESVILAGPLIPIVPLPLFGKADNFLEMHLKIKSSINHVRFRLREAYIETAQGRRTKIIGYIPGKYTGDGKRVRLSSCSSESMRFTTTDGDIEVEASGVISYCFEPLLDDETQEIYFYPALLDESGELAPLKFHLRRVRGTSYVLMG